MNKDTTWHTWHVIRYILFYICNFYLIFFVVTLRLSLFVSFDRDKYFLYLPYLIYIRNFHICIFYLIFFYFTSYFLFLLSNFFNFSVFLFLFFYFSYFFTYYLASLRSAPYRLLKTLELYPFYLHTIFISLKLSF